MAKDETWRIWALGVSISIIFVLVGVVMTFNQHRLAVIEDNVNTINDFHVKGNERLVALETNYDNIEKKLDKIEVKIDKLSET